MWRCCDTSSIICVTSTSCRPSGIINGTGCGFVLRISRLFGSHNLPKRFSRWGRTCRVLFCGQRWGGFAVVCRLIPMNIGNHTISSVNRPHAILLRWGSGVLTRSSSILSPRCVFSMPVSRGMIQGKSLPCRCLKKLVLRITALRVCLRGPFFRKTAPAIRRRCWSFTAVTVPGSDASLVVSGIRLCVTCVRHPVSGTGAAGLLHPHLVHKQPGLGTGTDVPFGHLAVVLDFDFHVAGVSLAVDREVINVCAVGSWNINVLFAE